jgi:prepilin-type N-terminal cleavage/methylation domain-containing protein
MERKNSGFTLIELLVVIVIIGILATISTATFSSYFGKARDAARTTSVSSMTLMIKVDGADVWDDTKYIYDNTTPGKNLSELFEKNDYRMQKGVNNICYFIGMVPHDSGMGDDNEFVIATWGEETSTKDPTKGGLIVDGTSQAMQNVIDGTGPGGTVDRDSFACDASGLTTVNTAFVTSLTNNNIYSDVVGGYLYIDEDGIIQSHSGSQPRFIPPP